MSDPLTTTHNKPDRERKANAIPAWATPSEDFTCHNCDGQLYDDSLGYPRCFVCFPEPTKKEQAHSDTLLEGRGYL